MTRIAGELDMAAHRVYISAWGVHTGYVSFIVWVCSWELEYGYIIMSNDKCVF